MNNNTEPLSIYHIVQNKKSFNSLTDYKPSIFFFLTTEGKTMTDKKYTNDSHAGLSEFTLSLLSHEAEGEA